ncbi:hypothetical protein TURU_003808 [Turdus rufiventris]|nr:hypothetical protein TURU_003808 [Turdus rufiventris]
MAIRKLKKRAIVGQKIIASGEAEVVKDRASSPPPPTRLILHVGNTWALQMSVPPSLNKFPFGEQKVHLQCVHKDLQVKILLIAGFSIFTAVFRIGFRNEEQWILQDALGISMDLSELHIEGSPNIKGSKLVSSGIVICKVFLVLTAPPLARSGDSIAKITILGPLDEAHHKKIQLLLKIPV